MNYEWDQSKNLENIKKHKVSFEQAKIALEDPYGLCFYDEAHSFNEDRYIVFANAEGRILFVSIVWADENTIRVISARRANKNEMEVYNGNRSLFLRECT